MDLETCIKYLDFIGNECDRHLEDGKVTNEELTEMVIEFSRFQDRCRDSDLPDDLKEKIAALKLDYTISNIERSYWLFFAIFITLGVWAGIYWYRRQRRRKRSLYDIKGHVSGMSVDIKMNYQLN